MIFKISKPLKILIVSPEVTPYAKTGGLADVSGALPKALCELGHDVRVILPLYKSIFSHSYKLEKVKSGVFNGSLGKFDPFDLYCHKQAGVTTYFVDHKGYFDRDELYGDKNGDYPDNAFRFSFFSKAVLAAIKSLNFKCDILHCNDWQSALVPFYLKYKMNKDKFYKNIKTLFTIHNLAYQGQFPRSVMDEVGIPDSFFNMHALEFHGKINFMKSGILYSDTLSTVSKGYAREILTTEYGCGLEGTLRTRKQLIFGITNGADYSEWNPEGDEYIKENYNSGSIEKKGICKGDLLDHVGLELSPDRPLLGVVTRLAWQKGMDLLAAIMEDIVASNAGVIVLGKGENKYERLLLDLQEKYPKNLSINIKFDNELAHKIEAGADFFLMPSRYEPCGLNQMYSLKYGTMPIVRATGGLDDVITDISDDGLRGNGFKFENAEGSEFFGAIKKAINFYENRDVWRQLITRVMEEDFSWGHSAEEYVKLYEKIMSWDKAHDTGHKSWFERLKLIPDP